MCQNLQVQVEELRSVNESLNLSVEELYKARTLAEVTLRERDELVFIQCEKIRLLEEQSEPFYEVHSEFDSEIVLDTQDNSEKDLILSLQTQVKETAELVVTWLNQNNEATDLWNEDIEEYGLVGRDKTSRTGSTSVARSASSVVVDTGLVDALLSMIRSVAALLIRSVTWLNPNNEATDSWNEDIEEYGLVGRDKTSRTGSTSVARSASSVVVDTGLVDALLSMFTQCATLMFSSMKEASFEYLRIKERELEMKDQGRREEVELERLKLAQRDQELEMQEKMLALQQEEK
nr:hypothetical protein [Tanacetum cinerariifolium]